MLDPNGAGKTTTLRVIAGLLQCDRFYIGLLFDFLKNDLLLKNAKIKGSVSDEPISSS